MTGGPRVRMFDDSEGWLERLTAKPPATTGHACGQCRTPYGRSTLPCPNDPNNPRRRTNG